MDGIALRVRQRPCKHLSITTDGDRIVLTENRRSLWILLAVMGLCGVVLVYIFLVPLLDDPDVALSAMICAGLLGAMYGFVLLVVCPWNRRVTLDREAETCRLQYRFYVVPFWFRVFCTKAGNLEITTVVHVTYSNNVPSKSVGDRAVGMMLGTAGALLNAVEVFSSRVEHHNRHFALVYQRPGARSLPILVTCRDGRSMVQALHKFCQRSFQADRS